MSLDYYNCSPCDFYTLREKAFSCGYAWDEKNQEYVRLEDLEDQSEEIMESP